VCVCVCVCNKVLQCVYVISRVHYAGSKLYIYVRFVDLIVLCASG